MYLLGAQSKPLEAVAPSSLTSINSATEQVNAAPHADSTSVSNPVASNEAPTGGLAPTTQPTSIESKSSPPVTAGFSLEKNAQIAARYFNMSANQNNADAQFNLAVLYMSGNGVEQSFTEALKYFALASQQGQTLAKYFLGILYKDGLGTVKNCQIALQLFKQVVEKASWLSSIDKAFEDYSNGEDYHSALYTYQQFAELGIEVAQSNTAYMFDRGYGIDAFMRDHSDEYEQLQRAIFWYKRAADQGNVEAHVKVGDFYYYGTSGLTNAVASNHTEMHNVTVRFEKSVYHYRRAADLRNAQAMFNLGIMHEHGLGLPKDFHLAKRYYDMASETDTAAAVPVYMALSKLYAHWGLSIARDFIYNKLIAWGVKEAQEESTTPPQAQQPAFTERPIVRALINLVKIETYNKFYQNLTWDRVMMHEDVILASLIGLLLFLAFIRYVYTNNLNEQRRIQQQLRQQP